MDQFYRIAAIRVGVFFLCVLRKSQQVRVRQNTFGRAHGQRAVATSINSWNLKDIFFIFLSLTFHISKDFVSNS
jgi:hypothetical protein